MEVDEANAGPSSDNVDRQQPPTAGGGELEVCICALATSQC